MKDDIAGASPVEPTVRPVAEVRSARLRWHLPTPDADPVAKFLDNQTHLLYDQDALDAAVAAERERLEQKLAQAEYLIGAFERGADPADYSRDIAEFRA